MTETTYSIAELAREFGLTPRAIRYYEDQGLIAPARAGVQRVYTKRDRTRLKLTLRGRRLGLSLAEIRELIDMYDTATEFSQLERLLEPGARTSRRCWPRWTPSSGSAAACSPKESSAASVVDVNVNVNIQSVPEPGEEER